MTEHQTCRASWYLKSVALLLIATGLMLAANAQTPPAKTLNPFIRFRPQPLASSNPDASTKLPKFLAHRDYLAADGPHGMATADLNGDGILDLVLNDGNSTGVSVLLGNRDGSFQTFALFGCSCQFPFDVVVADFNSDGKNDVAVTSPNGVSILLGDGAGNLGTPRVLTAGISPERLVATDLNGDHKMDLAVTNLGSNTVSIFLGHGDGTFATATDITVGMGPSGLAAGDFNGDGKLDLAVANSGTLLGQNRGPNANTVAILLGDGKGGVNFTTFIPVEKAPQQVLLQDLDKDKKLDILVSTFAKGDISELRGNGDGTFQSPRIFHVGTRADAIRVADFNSDGKDDLLVTNGSLSTVSILFGDGTGNFLPPTSAPSGRTVSALATGDFNHDGKTDYITANFDSNTVSVVVGKGNGKFLDLVPALPIGTDFPNQTITADFNGDGLPDLALVDTGSNRIGNAVEVLLGNSKGGFGRARAFAAGTQPEGLVATDFNHDGHLDLVVTDFGTVPSDHGGISLLLGNGDGSFQRPVSFAAGDFPVGIARGDFNGDGNPDVVVADFGTSAGVAAVTLMLGDGNHGFRPAQNVVTFPTFTVFDQILSGDFNRDGKDDIAYISSLNDNRVSVQFGNGDGTFQPAIPVVVRNVFTTIFFSFAAGDLNNDGISDFVVEEGGVIEVILNDGNGHFTSAGVFDEQSGASFGFVPALVLADFNGDGVLDVAAPDGFAETMAVLLGNGDGTLGPAALFGGGLADSATAVTFAGFQPSVVLGTPKQVLVVKNMTTSN
ncbi:MAG TPA: VCBS repeat-containing protein [Terriglobales bacterium]